MSPGTKTVPGPVPGVSRAQAAVGLLLDRHGPGLFRFLRRRCPVVATRKIAVVVRDADVRQVLGRREDFSVAAYTNKIMEVTGPFALAFDDPQDYDGARQLLDRAILPDDVARICRRSGELANEAVARAEGRGEIDVVGELVDPVLARVVGDHLGVGSRDWQTLLEWTRIVFAEIFFSPKDHVRPPALRVAEMMRARFDEVIAGRKAAVAAGQEPPDDVLSRLLASDVPDRMVCGTLLGLMVAWIPNTSKTTALVFDELLDRPDVLREAQAIARVHDADLAPYLFEAARLRPQGPGIFRTTVRDCRLGLDSGRPRTVRAGSLVMAATQSAMMDEDAVTEPDRFRVDRPWSDYLHFGYGLHTCAGQALTRAAMPAIARALLRQGPLRRAPGPAGRLAWRFPFPSALTVAFTPGEPVADDHGDR